jgi:hypothetical protein
VEQLEPRFLLATSDPTLLSASSTTTPSLVIIHDVAETPEAANLLGSAALTAADIIASTVPASAGSPAGTLTAALLTSAPGPPSAAPATTGLFASPPGPPPAAVVIAGRPLSVVGLASVPVSVLPSPPSDTPVTAGATQPSSDVVLLPDKGTDQVTGTLTAVATQPLSDVVLLPAKSRDEVTGTLTASKPDKWYQVALDARTDSLEIDLRVAPKPGPMSLEVRVLDASGQELGHAEKVVGYIKMVLSVAAAKARGDSSLFVEVTARPTGSSAAPFTLPFPVDFALQVTRESAPAPAPSPIGSGSGVTPSSPQGGGADRTALSLRSGGTSSPGAALMLAVTDAVLEPKPVVTGPLPTRAVAPLGGVLADGDPVPQAGRHGALVDLALIGVPARDPGAEPADGGAPATGGDESRAGAVVAVRGPGGFPLLASALRGGAHPGRAAALAAPLWLAGADVQAESLTPDLAEVPRRPGRRGSVAAGTCAALVLVFGLVLPDVAQALPFAPLPRFRIDLRRLRRAGRSSKKI